MSGGALILEAWGVTDVGMKRRLNEDVFLVRDDLGLYLVADGMGGHAAGEVASELAARAIAETIERTREIAEDGTWPVHWDPGRSTAANLLADAILEGHRAVTREVETHTELKGMGTTVVAAFRPGPGPALVIGHVGDSRAYLYRDGELELLTEDHSWVHEQVKGGHLSEEAARSHPLKNVVTQALGGSVEPTVDLLELELRPGDLVLLCSDGLNTMLRDEEIAEILAEGGELEETAQALVIAANQHGGNDNVTVVLVRAREAEPDDTAAGD